jgi:hypothetical protein
MPHAADDPVEVARLRLAEPEAAVRRIAILDLVRLAAKSDGVNAALLEHLQREPDEKAAIVIVRHLGQVGFGAARPVLKALYDTLATPPRLAHAAILAHDRIELILRLSA